MQFIAPLSPSASLLTNVSPLSVSILLASVSGGLAATNGYRGGRRPAACRNQATGPEFNSWGRGGTRPPGDLRTLLPISPKSPLFSNLFFAFSFFLRGGGEAARTGLITSSGGLRNDPEPDERIRALRRAQGVSQYLHGGILGFKG